MRTLSLNWFLADVVGGHLGNTLWQVMDVLAGLQVGQLIRDWIDYSEIQYTAQEQFREVKWYSSTSSVMSLSHAVICQTDLLVSFSINQFLFMFLNVRNESSTKSNQMDFLSELQHHQHVTHILAIAALWIFERIISNTFFSVKQSSDCFKHTRYPVTAIFRHYDKHQLCTSNMFASSK